MAHFSFRLRRVDTIDVSIVATGGEVVRSIATDVRRGRGRARFRWNGRSDTGAVVPDGAYRVRVSLADDGRTVTFAKRIFVDTRAPEVELVEVEPDRIEPGDSVVLRFELDEAARVILRVDGRRAARLGRFDRGSREAIWAGTVRGDALPPGDHELSLRVRDRAGNRARTAGTLGISAASDSTMTLELLAQLGGVAAAAGLALLLLARRARRTARRPRALDRRHGARRAVARAGGA